MIAKVSDNILRMKLNLKLSSFPFYGFLINQTKLEKTSEVN